MKVLPIDWSSDHKYLNRADVSDMKLERRISCPFLSQEKDSNACPFHGAFGGGNLGERWKRLELLCERRGGTFNLRHLSGQVTLLSTL